jgi:hypothetical protein
MPLTIKVREQDEEQKPSEENIKINIEKEIEESSPIKLGLRARKSLDGTIMITDHYVIDMAIAPGTNKVLSFPKKTYTDDVYAAQNRLFDHLTKAGIIDRESVQSGAVHGSLEGNILESATELPTVDLTLLSIGKFIEKEKPEYMFQEAYDEEVDEMYTDPDDEESTELGEVPQEAHKGSIQDAPTYTYNYLGSRI